jgi:hypothetical protein
LSMIATLRQTWQRHYERSTGKMSIGKSNDLFHRRRAPPAQPRSARRAELLKRRPRTSGTVCPWGKAKEEGKAKADWFKRLGLSIAARRRLIQTSGTVVAIVPFSSLTAFSIAGVRGTERSKKDASGILPRWRLRRDCPRMPLDIDICPRFPPCRRLRDKTPHTCWPLR